MFYFRRDWEAGYVVTHRLGNYFQKWCVLSANALYLTGTFSFMYGCHHVMAIKFSRINKVRKLHSEISLIGTKFLNGSRGWSRCGWVGGCLRTNSIIKTLPPRPTIATDIENIYNKHGQLNHLACFSNAQTDA
jgi:hypothetical protein